MTITYKEPEKIELTRLGLGAWSYSKLKVLNKCPFQFYLKYVLKAKPIVLPPVSIQTESGKAVHRVLELVMMGKSIEDSFRIAKREYEEVLPGKLWEDGNDPEGFGGPGRSEFSITKFKERIDKFEKANPVKRYITELRIGVTKDWFPTGFFTNDPETPEENVFFRGVIDLVIQMENKDIIFIDHKKGYPAISGVRNLQSQLDLYKVMFSKGIEPYENGQSGVHFVNDAEITMGTTSTKYDIENTMVNRIEFELQGTIDKVKDLGKFKHIMGSQCQWCEYADPCKAGNLKALEEGSKKWFKIKEI